jgi:hypothetical protein
MKRSLWRNGINVIFSATLALAACKPVRQVYDLGRDIGQEFRRPILVSVDRRTHLILVIPPAKGDSTQRDTANPAVLARQVAEYAAKHYEHAGSIKTITVIFDAGNQPSAGDSSVAFEQFSWAKDDLSGRAPRASTGTPAPKSD